VTVRVFAGCAPNGEDAESQAVLEYTLRKFASLPVEIIWMRQSRDADSPFQGWRTELWSTPFSGFRWAVPELSGFEGRAIYMDSDVIARADIAELWRQEIPAGKVVLAKGGAESWRYCVSLWDCAAAAKFVEPISVLRARPGSHRSMTEFYRKNPRLVQAFQGHWNCIDGEDFTDLGDPRIKIIHYSSEAHQPHLRHALPRLAAAGQRHWFDGRVLPHWRPELQALFDGLLEEAIAAGFTPEKYVPAGDPVAYRIASHKNYASHRWAK
jgi:hypothetical protein